MIKNRGRQRERKRDRLRETESKRAQFPEPQLLQVSPQVAAAPAHQLEIQILTLSHPWPDESKTWTPSAWNSASSCNGLPSTSALPEACAGLPCLQPCPQPSTPLSLQAQRLRGRWPRPGAVEGALAVSAGLPVMPQGCRAGTAMPLLLHWQEVMGGRRRGRCPERWGSVLPAQPGMWPTKPLPGTQAPRQHASWCPLCGISET